MRYYKSTPMTLYNLQVSLGESNSSDNGELVITSRNGNGTSHIVQLVVDLNMLLQIVLLPNQPLLCTTHEGSHIHNLILDRDRAVNRKFNLLSNLQAY